jgi:glycosyltransferase involved in cell wall biosynthesis
VSECTKQDLVELYGVSPDRVDVVPLGVDAASFRAPSTQDVAGVKTRFGIDGPYLLFLGGIERRKNIPAIVRAFSQMDPDSRPKLVIAGGAVAWDPLASRSLRMGFEFLPRRARESIVFTGYVTDEEKVALLGGAEALVYPSLYEGFGLPVLEAMACGTPVVTSNVSSLPEVVGDAALLVDPRDDDEIADAMARVLHDDALRDRLRAAGPARAATFTWERTAQLTTRTLRRAAG